MMKDRLSIIQLFNYQNYTKILIDESSSSLEIILDELVMVRNAPYICDLLFLLENRNNPIKLTFKRNGKAVKAESILEIILETTRYISAFTDLKLKTALTMYMVENIFLSEHVNRVEIDNEFIDHSKIEYLFKLLTREYNDNLKDFKHIKCNLTHLTIKEFRQNMSYQFNIDNAKHINDIVTYLSSIIVYNSKLRVLKLPILNQVDLLNAALQNNYFLFDTNFERGHTIHQRNLNLYYITQKNALFFLLVKRKGISKIISALDNNILRKIAKLVFAFRHDLEHLKMIELTLEKEKQNG